MRKWILLLALLPCAVLARPPYMDPDFRWAVSGMQAAFVWDFAPTECLYTRVSGARW